MEHGNTRMYFPGYICYTMPCGGTMGIFDRKLLIGFMKYCEIIQYMWFYLNYDKVVINLSFSDHTSRLMVSVLASSVVNRG